MKSLNDMKSSDNMDYPEMWNEIKEQVAKCIEYYRGDTSEYGLNHMNAYTDILRVMKNLENKHKKTMRIWKRSVNPFRLGKESSIICTEVPNSMIKHSIGFGFRVIVLEHEDKTEVYEVQSGGLIGYSLDEVRKDVESCGDYEFMQRQIDEAKTELEREEVELVDIETFLNTI